MKKTISWIICLLIFLSSYAWNVPIKKYDLFQLDEQIIENELKDLMLLEEYVNGNEGIIFAEILYNAELTLVEQALNFKLEDVPRIHGTNEGPFGIPSFFWGMVPGFLGSMAGGLAGGLATELAGGLCCVFSPIGGTLLGLGGVALVYYETESRTEVQYALLGCIAGNVMSWGLLYVIGEARNAF